MTTYGVTRPQFVLMMGTIMVGSPDIPRMGYIIKMIADVLAPKRCQGINNHEATQLYTVTWVIIRDTGIMLRIMTQISCYCHTYNARERSEGRHPIFLLWAGSLSHNDKALWWNLKDVLTILLLLCVEKQDIHHHHNKIIKSCGCIHIRLLPKHSTSHIRL